MCRREVDGEQRCYRRRARGGSQPDGWSVGRRAQGIQCTDFSNADPQVYTPSMYPTLIGREKYDWCYQSVPQPNGKSTDASGVTCTALCSAPANRSTAGNKTYSMPRGKLLGGSSGINYLMYVRGSKNDYDGFAELVGSDEWNFESLGPYFRKHQSLDTPNPKEKGFMPVGDPEVPFSGRMSLIALRLTYLDYRNIMGQRGR